MLTFLFWNLMGLGSGAGTWAERAPSLQRTLARFATRLGVRVFLFAESRFLAADLIHSLRRERAGVFRDETGDNTRLQVISNLSPGAFTKLYDAQDDRLAIYRLALARTDLLLAVLHFQSRLYWTAEDQALEMTAIPEAIARVEDTAGHRRTVLVGDFNMNPFDSGLSSAKGLNAVMTADLARRPDRVVAGKPYRRFYNPMWGAFGDRTGGPPGTLFFSPPGLTGTYWQMLRLSHG